MKLRYSASSPYTRKVLILAHEAGVVDRMELINTLVSPVTVNAELGAENPLAKLPTLVLDDGTALFDSRVIAEYLDHLAGTGFFPAPGPARWDVLRRQATADGVLDAALLIRYERNLRPPEHQLVEWTDGQYRKLRQAVDMLEVEAKTFSPQLTIGEIAVAATLGYLDFRFPEEDWRGSHPRLATFYAGFAERPSMKATRPPAA